MLQLKVKKIMEERGLTKYWLHKHMSGMTWRNVSRLLDCKTNAIHFDTLEKLTDVLDCSIDDLFERVDDTENKA